MKFTTLNLKNMKVLMTAVFAFMTFGAQAQYQFPECGEPWDANHDPYQQGEIVSYEGKNYEAKYYAPNPPGGAEWQLIGACGDDALGEDFVGEKRIIGYMPNWRTTSYDAFTVPEAVTHMNVSFLTFKQNNNNWNSADFASIAFDEKEMRLCDSIMIDLDLLGKAQAKGTKVSIAVGGAIDFAFLWLMEKYQNDDAKINEIADLIVQYVNERGLDGVDLDMEAWWADPAIAGTSDQGGRVRGDKWGGTDVGPHPAGIGLTKLAKALREKMPNKVLSAAVFGTSYYGNNYDDGMVEYLDWLGLMTYDFTGSWDKTPFGPHAALHKLPLGTYPGQSTDNPIYSAEDALEYWMGIAEPAWNHDGGFEVPKSKLCIGVPVYGYDFANHKAEGANGYDFVPYRQILEEYPGAETSYDAQEPGDLSGRVTGNGKDIYFDTPNAAKAKMNYVKDYGHQGVIVWEMSMDADYNNPASLFRALNDAKGSTVDVNSKPSVNVSSPVADASFDEGTDVTITVDASDADGTVSQVEFFINNVSVGTDASAPYEYTASNLTTGSYTISAKATDNENAVSTSSNVSITIEGVVVVNEKPTVSVSASASSVDINTAVTLSASASDSDGSVSQVEFFVNGSSVGTDASAPYSVSWTPTTAGNYNIEAIATDNENTISDASAVSVIANDPTNPNSAPTASNLAVSSNSVDEGDDITITVDASDVDGNLTSVEFLVDGSVISTDVTAPFSATWTATGVGSHTIQTTATDSEGLSATVSTNVTVNEVVTNECTAPVWDSNANNYNGGDQVSYNGRTYEAKWWTQQNPEGSSEWNDLGACDGSTTTPNAKPTASISVSNNVIETNTAVTISASASDSDGSVSQVEFFANGTSVGVDTSAPYSVSWTPTSAGTYSLQVIATDNENATSTASTTSVSVSDATTGGGDCGNIAEYATYPSVYNSGDQVSYNGVIYECQVNNLYNVTPGTAEHWWATIGACSSARVEAQTSLFDATLYPNPVADLASVRLTLGENTSVKLFIINTLGEKVADLTEEMPAGNHTLRINTNGFSAGVYLMKIQTNTQSLTQKFVKK